MEYGLGTSSRDPMNVPTTNNSFYKNNNDLYSSQLTTGNKYPGTYVTNNTYLGGIKNDYGISQPTTSYSFDQ